MTPRSESDRSAESDRTGAAAAVGKFVLLLAFPFLLAGLGSYYCFACGTDMAKLACFWATLLATYLGELVGLSEVISRYRDEPVRASFNINGIVYFLINGTLSWTAFVAVHNSGYFPSLSARPFSLAVLAGFGAMAVFRSKIFTYRTEDGKDIPVGPDIVLSSILKTVDRRIDRVRAVRRQQLVFREASEIADLIATTEDFDVAANFLVISMSAFQNLSDQEKQQIFAVSDRLKKELKGSTHLYKAMTLGFALLEYTGEDSFSDITADLKAYLQKNSPQPAAGAGGGPVV